MKKFKTLLAMALIAMISLSFTSCDKDAEIAYNLDGGTWRGTMYTYYGGYEATSSVIHFNQNDGWRSGDGYWIDYFSNYYWHNNNYIANHISWTVNNGNINIYLEEEGIRVVIYNYVLTDSRFSGVIELSNGERKDFSLYRDNYGYNWNNYYWGYSKQSAGLDSLHITSRAAADSVNSYIERPVRTFAVK